MATIKKGDSLWAVNRWRKDEGRAVIVEKVGRLYVHTKCGRRMLLANLEKGEAWDANHVYYLSEDACKKVNEHAAAEQALKTRIKRSNLTLEQINGIKTVMGWGDA